MITTRGRGAQKAARDAGARYVYQTDPRGPDNAYYGYKTAAERDQGAAAHIAAGLEVVERVDGCSPARAYIDVDAPADATDNELEDIVAAFREAAAEMGAPQPDPIVNACDRANKRSMHLIADGWALPNGLAVKNFAEEVAAALEGTRMADWVDRSGGARSYGLRVAGCPKGRDVTAILQGELTWLEVAGDTILTPAHALLPAAPAEPVTSEDFLEEVATAYAGVYELDPLQAGEFSRVAPSFCKACDREHDRAGAYVSSAPDGSQFFRCRRTPSDGPALLCRLINVEPPPDRFDDLSEFESVGGPGIYNESAIGDGEWDLYAASAWGTGKSVHNASIVRDLLARKPNAVVLVISCRKSLSAQLANDISATCYDKIKGNLDPTKNPVSVWQVDSMARIPPSVVPDLLIVDELSQLTAHAWQDNNGRGKAAAGMSSLRALVQRAGRIIVSDNDLTEAQVDAFKKVRKGRASRVVRNTFQPWAATTTKIFTGDHAAPSVLTRMWRHLDTQFARRAAGIPWEASAAPCHSLRVARMIHEEAIRRYGDELVKCYHSESSDTVKRTDFADAGASWDPADGLGPLLVVYTSTVSVGVSCPSARFTKCFAFFKTGNCAATQSAQMLFRCRKLNEVVIAFSGTARSNRPQSPKALFQWVLDSRNVASLPDGFRHDRNAFITTPTALDPKVLEKELTGNFEGSLWIANSMEANRSARWFVPRLKRIIERAGMVVTVEVAEKSDDLFNAEDAQAAADDKRAAVMAAELPRRHADAVDAMLGGQEDEQADRSAEDKAGDRAHFIVKALNIDFDALIAHFDDTNEGLATWLASYEDIAPQYRAACRVVNKASKTAAELSTSSEQETDGLTRNIFEILGAAACAEVLVVEPERMLAAPVTELAGRINTHSSRMYDDKHGARRDKAIAGTQVGHQRKAVAASLNIVLRAVGGEIRPAYDTERQQKQGTPARWELGWKWQKAPEPRPQHPKAPVADLTIVDNGEGYYTIETSWGPITSCWRRPGALLAGS